jgi:hypothetical protein
MKVLEQLAEREKNDEVAARVAYLQLVKQLADGVDDPTLEDVERILDLADKSTAELREDVRKRQSRDELRAQIVAGETASARQAEIEQSRREWAAELALAQQTYNARMASVHWESVDCGRISQMGVEAARQLRLKCQDPLINGRLKELRQTLDQLDEAVDAAKERVSSAQSMISSEEARRQKRPESVDPHALRRYRNRLEARQAELEQFRAQRALLLAEQRELLAAAEAV